MKHPLSNLQEIVDSKIHKTVGELRYDVSSWLECHREELQQLFDLEQQKEAHNPHTFAVIIYLKQQILGVGP